MKASTLLLSAGLALTSAGVCSAQVITTFETVTAWDISGATNSFGTGTAIAQTFQLPGASKIVSMSWHFVTPSNVIGTSTLEAYLTEWNTTTNKPTGAAIWSDLTASLPAYGNGFHDLTLTPNFVTDAGITYAMILRGTAVANRVHISNADLADDFSYGRNYRAGLGATSFASLAGLTYDVPGQDWGFSQITLELTPIPETGTVAVVFVGALVAGLSLRRRPRTVEALVTDTAATA
ncbi:MAG: hypothetical protein H7067_12615 [Burkholderiales bacterium]|nr:hypothetical protein [Opitutaceae bacterium]